MAVSDWVPLWIQAAVAVGTLGLAAGTVFLGLKARDEASATETLARETRTDRQLQWRPQLDLTVCWVDISPGAARFFFNVFNAGGGPAIACKALARTPADINIWGMWAAGDISPNSGNEHDTEVRKTGSLYAAFGAPEAMAEPRREPDVVLICADVLGRRYRFPIVDVFDQTTHATNPRETWKPFPPDIYDGGPDAPTWTGHPLLWSY